MWKTVGSNSESVSVKSAEILDEITARLHTYNFRPPHVVTAVRQFQMPRGSQRLALLDVGLLNLKVLDLEFPQYSRTTSGVGCVKLLLQSDAYETFL